jgi:hypothetical protein
MILFLAVGASACSSSAIGTGSSSSSSSSSSSGSSGIVQGDTPPSDGTSSGSANSSQWDPLFDAPASSNATPDSLFGRWAGQAGASDELRLVLTASSITQARHCAAFGNTAASTIGASAQARVTETSIAPLESKTVGAFPCDLAIRANALAPCNFDQGVLSNCFELSGTTLAITTDAEGKTTYTKLSDE